MAGQEIKAVRDPFNVTKLQAQVSRLLASGLKLAMRAQKYSNMPPSMISDFVDGASKCNSVLAALAEERPGIVQRMEAAALERAKKALEAEKAGTVSARPRRGR